MTESSKMLSVVVGVIVIAVVASTYNQEQNRQAYYKCLETVQKTIDANIDRVSLPYCHL
jgi:hypothetical protein